tara:strand:+ start:201 stop:422 length:222 start_codon:yes stop_codon:yes gene_type:complete
MAETIGTAPKEDLLTLLFPTPHLQTVSSKDEVYQRFFLQLSFPKPSRVKMRFTPSCGQCRGFQTIAQIKDDTR